MFPYLEIIFSHVYSLYKQCNPKPGAPPYSRCVGNSGSPSSSLVIKNSLAFALDIGSLVVVGRFRDLGITILTASSMAFSSVQFSRSVISDSLQPHGLQHIRLHCPSPTARVYSNSCPLVSDAIQPSYPLSSFSSLLQSLPASGYFPMNQFFPSRGQSIEVPASASVLPMHIQDWFPLGWTEWICLLAKGLSRVFSNTTARKHQFFSAQLSL